MWATTDAMSGSIINGAYFVEVLMFIIILLTFCYFERKKSLQFMPSNNSSHPQKVNIFMISTVRAENCVQNAWQSEVSGLVYKSVTFQSLDLIYHLCKLKNWSR